MSFHVTHIVHAYVNANLYRVAYDDVMKILTIAATVFAVVPFALAFWMPNWYLGDQQNAVDNVDLAGEKVNNPDLEPRQP